MSVPKDLVLTRFPWKFKTDVISSLFSFIPQSALPSLPKVHLYFGFLPKQVSFLQPNLVHPPSLLQLQGIKIINEANLWHFQYCHHSCGGLDDQLTCGLSLNFFGAVSFPVLHSIHPIASIS